MSRMTHETVKLQMHMICADVAINWHMHGVVEQMRMRVNQLDDLIAQVGAHASLQDLTADLTREKNLVQSVISEFLELWPAPDRQMLKDTFKYVSDDVYFRALNGTPMTQSAPKEPLTLLSRESKKSKPEWYPFFLLYTDQKGLFYKVPNCSYNQPNLREKIEWPDSYLRTAA